MDYIKRILFLLASSEVDSGFATGVRQQINTNAVPIQTRYKAMAELILSAALNREPRLEIRSKKDRIEIAGENVLDLSEESGITFEGKRSDALNGLIKRFGLDGIPDNEMEKRLGNRLETYIKTRNPFYVAHTGPKSLSIQNLVEFLFPPHGVSSDSKAHTATDEETIMGLIEIIMGANIKRNKK